MKLLFITSGYVPMPPANGGAVETLLDTILKQNEITKKHDITVYSVYDSKANSMVDSYKKTKFIFVKKTMPDNLYDFGIRVINRIFKNSYFYNSFVQKIKKDLKKKYKEKNSKFEYDRIVVENEPLYILPLKKYLNGRKILHLHNDYLNENSIKNKEIFDSFDEIYAVSKFLKNKVDKINCNKQNNKTKVLYNGIDIQKYLDLNQDSQNKILKLQEKYNINKKDCVIIYSGRIVPEKGIKELLMAFNDMKVENLKLLILGSLDCKNNKRTKFIDELIKLKNDNVIFTGYVDHNEIPRFYQLGDIGVIPSLCEEGFALSVLENLAAGNPVIISDSGAMNELVDSQFSITVKRDENFIKMLKQAMELIIDNNNEYARKLASSKAKEFSSNKYCDRFFDLIE